MAHDPLTGMLVASKPSSNHLMPGYGLMKVCYHSNQHEDYIIMMSSLIPVEHTGAAIQ